MKDIRVARIDAVTGFVDAFWQRSLPDRALRVSPVRAGSRWLLPYVYFNVPSYQTSVAVADPGMSTPFRVFSIASVVADNPSLATAAAEGRVTFAWASQRKIALFQSTTDGVGTDREITMERKGRVGELALAWSGSEYVLVWTEYAADMTAESLLAAAVRRAFEAARRRALRDRDHGRDGFVEAIDSRHSHRCTDRVQQTR